jgi:hypothetical protein
MPREDGRLRGMRLLLLLPLFLFGCDNSGGPAPSGTELAIESTGWGFIEPCFGGDDDAALLDSVAAVTTWLDPCGAPNVEKQNQIVNTMSELDGTRRLMAARIVLGGCTQDWHLAGLYQDAATVSVWILKADTSLNSANAACTDDIGWAEGYWIAAEGDLATATTGVLHLGSYNPAQPGAPASPGG